MPWSLAILTTLFEAATPSKTLATKWTWSVSSKNKEQRSAFVNLLASDIISRNKSSKSPKWENRRRATASNDWHWIFILCSSWQFHVFRSNGKQNLKDSRTCFRAIPESDWQFTRQTIRHEASLENFTGKNDQYNILYFRTKRYSKVQLFAWEKRTV